MAVDTEDNHNTDRDNKWEMDLIDIKLDRTIDNSMVAVKVAVKAVAETKTIQCLLVALAST
jgi:hypothetical protein